MSPPTRLFLQTVKVSKVSRNSTSITRNRLFAEMTSGWIFKLVKILKIIYNKIL